MSKPKVVKLTDTQLIKQLEVRPSPAVIDEIRRRLQLAHVARAIWELDLVGLVQAVQEGQQHEEP